MYYVYILKSSKTPKLYYGYTSDLKRRFKEHNEGKSQFTKPCIPWKLVWYCAFEEEQNAKDFELFINLGSGKAFVYKRLINVALAKDASVTNEGAPKF